MGYGTGKIIYKNCQKGIYKNEKHGIIKIGSHKNVVAIKVWFKITSLIARRDVILLYLLIIKAKAIIKANAIIDVVIHAVKSNIIICNIVSSIISITSLS